MDKDSADDFWDDTILIKAYDNSIKLARIELAKRIAQSTNTFPNNRSVSDLDQINSKDHENIKLGDYVRSTYDDGVDYEAKVVALSENGMCTIKYVGYDNEQEVEICNLIPSWGKKSRRVQFSKAKQDTLHFSKNSDKQRQSIGSAHQIPPPPPMPPMFNNLNEDSEHISAMLMAWYMSGYYTGLYEGQKIVKSRNKT